MTFLEDDPENAEFWELLGGRTEVRSRLHELGGIRYWRKIPMTRQLQHYLLDSLRVSSAIPMDHHNAFPNFPAIPHRFGIKDRE